MGAFVARRAIAAIPTIFGVTLLTFLLFHAFGGNPAYEFLGKNASAADVAALERELGLDRPLWAQYLRYLGEIVRFDFGRSFVTKQPVRDMLLGGLGPSLSLTVPALLLTTLLAGLAGLLSAFFRGRPLDRALVLLAIVLMSSSFLLYIVAGQYLLAFKWPLFHIHGYAPGPLERWAYLSLPILILVVVSFGYDARYYRAVLVEEASREHVTAARARGLSEPKVMAHVLRNAMVPIITRVMISMPFLITGSLLLESFFGIPGLGSAMLDALNRSDFPVVKAYTVVFSIFFVVTTIFTDLLYATFDPRVRLS